MSAISATSSSHGISLAPNTADGDVSEKPTCGAAAVLVQGHGPTLVDDLRALLQAGTHLPDSPDEPGGEYEVSFKLNQFLLTFGYNLFFPLSWVWGRCVFGAAFTDNMSLLKHLRPYVRLYCTVLIVVKLGIALRDALLRKVDFDALLHVDLPDKMLADENIVSGWVVGNDKVFMKEIRAAAIADSDAGKSDLRMQLHRRQYRTLLSMLSRPALELLQSLLAEAAASSPSLSLYTLPAPLPAAATADPLLVVVKAGSDDTATSQCSLGTESDAMAGKSAPSFPAARVHPPDVESPTTLHEPCIVCLPVCTLCAVLLRHVQHRHFPGYDRILSLLSLVGMVTGLVPAITRAAWSVDSSAFSYSSQAMAIVVLVGLANVCSGASILGPVGFGIIDMRRRLACVQLLGELLAPRRQGSRSFSDSDVATWPPAPPQESDPKAMYPPTNPPRGAHRHSALTRHPWCSPR